MSNQVVKLCGSLLKDSIDEAVLITSDINIRYFTGFPNSEGAVFICKDEAYLLVDFRNIEAATLNSKNVKVEMFTSLTSKIAELIKLHNIKKVYLENEFVTYNKFRTYELLFQSCGAQPVFGNALDGMIKSMRAIKDDYDISRTMEAQRLTDEAFNYILPKIKEGVSERDLSLEIEFFMRKNGAERVAFDLIVVTGAKTSQCHGVPGNEKVKKGDFITMDTGAVVDGYHSDMTRTVALGSVTDEQREVYNTVLKAQLAVFDAIKPGAVCKDVDKVARDIIYEKYEGFFGHGLGHGVGFEIHENPRFNKSDNTILKPGMLMTNEPGIYLPGKFGVRIEDLVLVTKNGYKILTKSPKELIIL